MADLNRWQGRFVAAPRSAAVSRLFRRSADRRHRDRGGAHGRRVMATAVNRVELASIRFGDELAQITERLRRATVQVRDAYASGQGSGVIWSSNGVIVTNAHVVRSPTQQ